MRAEASLIGQGEGETGSGAAPQSSPWDNWSGSVHCRPKEVLRPGSIEELVEIVRTCGRDRRHVRAVGSGHSFSPLVATDDVMVSLEKIQGVQQVDAEHGAVTVLAGTTLKSLGHALHAHGLAQENLGGIDAQTLAGAISTGTHGTGMRFGSLSTQVEGLTLVMASGELLDCSAERNPDIFRAAQVSLGTLGIITQVKLRVGPAKRLAVTSRRERFDKCLANLERYEEENSHFEFLWFPRTPWVQTKFLNETDSPVSSEREDSNGNGLVDRLYGFLSECCRLVPPLSRTISGLSALAAPNANGVNYSHRQYLAPLMVRAQAMEYAIPVQHARRALREIADCMDLKHFQVHVPLGVRFMRADDIWLSPGYQRDSVCIAPHMYRGRRHEAYFGQIEAIFKRYEGRPHWGKIHSLDATQLARLYPRWQDFQRVRAALDPEGLFLNDYLRRLFDADTSVSPVAIGRDEFRPVAPAPR